MHQNLDGNIPALLHWVQQRGPLPGDAVYKLAVEMAAALSQIHAAQAVHGHVNPGAIAMTSEGARLTPVAAEQVPQGSAFLAPEQLDGGAPTPASDVFAWAATLAYASSGQPPFGEGTAQDVLDRIWRAEPELDGLPAALRGMVATCLAPDPDQRPRITDLAAHLTIDGTYGQIAASAPAEPAAAAEGGPWRGSSGMTGEDAPASMSTNLVQIPTSKQKKQKARRDRKRPGERTDYWGERKDARGERRRRVVARPQGKAPFLAGLVAAGVVLAGATTYGVGGASSTREDPAAPPGQSAPPAEPSQPGPPAEPGQSTQPAQPAQPGQPGQPGQLPAGYSRASGPGGSSIAIPDGWSRTRNDGQLHRWQEAPGGAVIQVSTVQWGTQSPSENWQKFEAGNVRAFNGLNPQRIKLTSEFSFRGWQTSDYEATYTVNGRRLHGYGRAFTANGQQYTIYLESSADRWNAHGARAELLWNSFAPGGQ